MSRLSEILAKRNGVSNVSAKPVLQPETKQETPPQEAKGTEGSVLSAEAGKEADITPGIQGTIPEPATVNNVVEQGPPAGLKGLALLRWKKEHATTNVNAAATSPTPKDIVGEKPNSVSPPKQPEVSQQVQQVSASQSADALKQNDGRIALEELRNNLNYLANSIEQKELVAQIVRTIAVQLQNAPELCPQMSHADVNLMVRGLRRGYSIAARKKQEIKETKATKTKDTSELAQAFRDAGLDGFNLNLK